MTRVIEWLLDLKDIRLGRDAPLDLKFGAAPPAWLLFGLALITVAVIVIIYRRERTTNTRKAVLAGVRVLIAVLLVVVLCRPLLVLQRNRVEPSYVALMVDGSHSMANRDTYDDPELAARIARGADLPDSESLEEHSRMELAVRALTREDGDPLRKLAAHNGVQLVKFAGATETQLLIESADAVPALQERIVERHADGTSTDIAGALQDVLDNARGRRLAAVVMVSDGQATQAGNLRDVLDLSRGRQVPIHAVRIGSPVRPIDVELGRPRYEETVFLNDLVAVEVPLTGHGGAEPLDVSVELVGESESDTYASLDVTLPADGNEQNVELRFRPRRTGRLRLRVRVPALPRERVTSNNESSMELTVLDDKVRVLYVEGYPRYEYRYLKNALLREKTAEVRVLLLGADRHFVQEGVEPLRRFPETPEQLNRFDVVLFGDVDPRAGWLTEAQMNMLLDYVGNQGGGFGVIAGERYAPHRFLDTPLAKLLPVRIDPNFLGRYEQPLASGFQMMLTPEGRRNRLFRYVSGDGEASADAERAEQFEDLPSLYWLARTLGPKPGAAVLAQHPTMRCESGPMPLIVTGRYGAGRLFFQATDDSWRWRRHTGELLHDTYWVEVVRELMRGDRLAQQRRYVLRTDRRTYPYGATVRTEVELLDLELAGLFPQEITLSVLDGGPESNGSAGTREPGTVVDRPTLQRIGEHASVYEGSFVPLRPGAYVVRADDLPVEPGQRPATVAIRVDEPDLEARQPEADHDTLEEMAVATGGRVVELDELSEAFAAIPDRSVRIPDDLEEPLWDSRLTMMLFIVLMSLEWGLRKAFGLL